MASTAVHSSMATSFVYEDLVFAVTTIQNQMNLANQIIDERSNNERDVQRQLASRSFVFIDPFGYRIEEQFADHWNIGKVVKKFHKDMCPKYLQSWIRIGLFAKGKVQAFKEIDLKKCVSQYPHGQEFIAYGKISLTLLNEGCQLLRECSLIVLLNEKRENLVSKVRSLRRPMESNSEMTKDITLKVCQPDTLMEHYKDRWIKGKDFQNGDTIFSARLYEPNSGMIAKHDGIKAYLAGPIAQQDIFVKTLTGATITILVDLDRTIGKAKCRVQEKEALLPDQQRWIHGGRQLEDYRTFIDYYMEKESTVHLMLSLRGGMYHFTSGRNGFDGLGSDCVKSVGKILRFKPNIDDLSRSTPIEKLQKYSIKAQSLLASLHSAVQGYPKTVDVPDLRDLISVPIDQHSDWSSDDDEDD